MLAEAHTPRDIGDRPVPVRQAEWARGQSNRQTAARIYGGRAWVCSVQHDPGTCRTFLVPVVVDRRHHEQHLNIRRSLSLQESRLHLASTVHARRSAGHNEARVLPIIKHHGILSIRSLRSQQRQAVRMGSDLRSDHLRLQMARFAKRVPLQTGPPHRDAESVLPLSVPRRSKTGILIGHDR